LCSWPISMNFPSLGKPAMEFTDRVLTCSDCGAEFVFTAGEQLFFHDKQFKNEPSTANSARRSVFVVAPGCAQRHGPTARSAARQRRFPSSPHRAGQCCAAPASSSRRRNSRNKGQLPPSSYAPSRVRSRNAWKETNASSSTATPLLPDMSTATVIGRDVRGI